MKIKINEKETYEIDISDGKIVSMNEFDYLVDRLIRIRKVFSNEVPINIVGKEIKKRTWTKHTKLPREKIVEAVKVYFSGLPKADIKLKIPEIVGYPYSMFSTRLFAYKKRHNLTPQEFGFTEWPTISKH